MTVGPHPIAYRREELRQMGIISASELRKLPHKPAGDCGRMRNQAPMSWNIFLNGPILVGYRAVKIGLGLQLLRMRLGDLRVKIADAVLNLLGKLGRGERTPKIYPRIQGGGIRKA
jgi:hypothetical protein